MKLGFHTVSSSFFLCLPLRLVVDPMMFVTFKISSILLFIYLLIVFFMYVYVYSNGYLCAWIFLEHYVFLKHNAIRVFQFSSLYFLILSYILFKYSSESSCPTFFNLKIRTNCLFICNELMSRSGCIYIHSLFDKMKTYAYLNV